MKTEELLLKLETEFVRYWMRNVSNLSAQAKAAQEQGIEIGRMELADKMIQVAAGTGTYKKKMQSLPIPMNMKPENPKHETVISGDGYEYKVTDEMFAYVYVKLKQAANASEKQVMEARQKAMDSLRKPQKSVEVKENTEKQGIEIRFAAYPGSETICLLKQSGFRWHNTGKYWYAKDKPETREVVKRVA